MKVLVAEKLAAPGVALLEKDGHKLVNKFVAGDALRDAMAEERPQVLIVRSTKVTAPIMDASPALELIIRAGAGFDTIDIDHASKKGIYVCNCPGKNSAAVAELAIGLILALDRRIADNVADARKGQWNKAKYSKAAGVTGKTLGIIGQGNIAKEVISRAKGLQMQVIAWSRSLTPAAAEEMGVAYAASPLEVAAKADIVSLHVAANAGTKKLANREFFEAMKKDAIFINTTRGSVVDEDALKWAMDTKGILAGLDVFENEPAGKEGPCEIPLAAHPNCYITHHIGASTDQAQDVTAVEAARIINKFAASQVADNCVNSEVPDSQKRGCITVRYMDQVGVLAAVLGRIKDAGWNVREISNVLFKGGAAAAVRIRYDVAEATPESPKTIIIMRSLLVVPLLVAVSNAFTSIHTSLTIKHAVNLNMAPRFDPKTQTWSPSTPEEGPDAGYDALGSLIRHGPLPFITRVSNPDKYEQAVLKFMASEKCGRDEAQGNMDAYFANANDWMEIKMREKKGFPKYDFAKAPKTKDVILISIWAGIVVWYFIKFIIVVVIPTLTNTN